MDLRTRHAENKTELEAAGRRGDESFLAPQPGQWPRLHDDDFAYD
jgi:hypothetical protein